MLKSVVFLQIELPPLITLVMESDLLISEMNHVISFSSGFRVSDPQCLRMRILMGVYIHKDISGCASQVSLLTARLHSMNGRLINCQLFTDAF